MLTVRFPNGQKLMFNKANYLTRGESYWDLYSDEKKTRWVASIQGNAGVIVEADNPCRVENPMVGLTERRAFEIVEKALSEHRCNGSCGLTEQIKRHLQHFNMRTWEWK